MAYRRRIEAATTLVLSLGSRGVDRMVWRGRQRGRGSGGGVDGDGEVFLVGGRATRSKNDQVPAVPTSFVGQVGARLEAFRRFTYKSGRQRTPISRANRCTRRFAPNQFGGYIRRKGKSLSID